MRKWSFTDQFKVENTQGLERVARKEVLETDGGATKASS